MTLSAQAAKQHTEPEILITEMVQQHGFDKKYLEKLFAQVKIKQSILKAMRRPGEAKPWFEYRKLFVTPKQIRQGVAFYKQHQKALQAAERQYGVPAPIIAAIIGVETRYGRNTGSYRVLDALSTLAFHYPKRATFFRKELVEFLLLMQEISMPPLTAKGSYAGAMGIGQFMPSSYRKYVVDFNGDGKRSIWEVNDAIGSVANYLQAHGWQAGQAIIEATQVQSGTADALLALGLKPKYNLTQLRKKGLLFSGKLPAKQKASLVMLKTETGEAYWLALPNFYVITRYNHSRRYAMAVNQLAENIDFQFHIQQRF
ncbi:lytic murein transglycosylase B [Candidatus Venteria ishoeyi]|nr:lytic murein transglycosylase B [Candidatus Venteria ishoeyi]MDM8545547.1 lytic murein transglycosylase B [Candidatus Venteria ishoeyi]